MRKVLSISMTTLIFTIVLSGCAESKSNLTKQDGNLSISTDKYTQSSTNSTESKINILQKQSDIANMFIEKLGYKIVMNSGVGMGIRLPKDFTVKKGETEIGKFLYEKNEQSKNFELDFSKYMGKSIYLLGHEITKNDIREGFIIMFFSNDNMIGAWIDQNKEEYDLKVITNNLDMYSY